jgi:hypothetical protein
VSKGEMLNVSISPLLPRGLLHLCVFSLSS